MTEPELADLVERHPTLYHMAARGSWPSIRRHGLLGTSALLDLFEVEGAERAGIERARRPDAVRLARDGVGEAVIRDQKPMDDAGLARALRDGTTPAEWYALLNARVFFWLSRARLLRLMNARAYAGQSHDVLEVDTAALVARHRDRITLAPINTGATKPFPAPRGRDTILPIPDYPYAARLKSHRAEPVVELAVAGGVPDIVALTRRVVVMRGPERGAKGRAKGTPKEAVEVEEIWRRG